LRVDDALQGVGEVLQAHLAVVLDLREELGVAAVAAFVQQRVEPVQVDVLFPAQQGRDGDEGGEHPDGGDHEGRPRRCARVQVVDRASDGPVAIQTDQANVHDGGRAEQDVQGGVDLAPHLAERPVTHQLVGQGERHDGQADEHVRRRQGGDEPVLHGGQVVLGGYGDDHQKITDDDDHHHEGHDQRQRDDRQLRILRRHHLHYLELRDSKGQQRGDVFRGDVDGGGGGGVIALRTHVLPQSLLHCELGRVQQAVVVVGEERHGPVVVGDGGDAAVRICGHRRGLVHPFLMMKTYFL
jgi:hypothetical protein